MMSSMMQQNHHQYRDFRNNHIIEHRAMLHTIYIHIYDKVWSHVRMPKFDCDPTTTLRNCYDPVTAT